jgi:hypothetical protein
MLRKCGGPHASVYQHAAEASILIERDALSDGAFSPDSYLAGESNLFVSPASPLFIGKFSTEPLHAKGWSNLLLLIIYRWSRWSLS